MRYGTVVRQVGAGEGWWGEVLTGWLALAQQQLAHLPEKPSQRLGDGKDGWTVAGVGRQPVRSETLRVSTLLRLLGF